jgi:outer membrane protein
MLQAGDMAGALAMLQASPQLSSRPDGLKLQAQLLLALKKPDQALLVLETILGQNPNDALARYQVGEAHFMSKRDKPAEIAYRLSLAGSLDAGRQGLARQRLKSLAQQARWQGSVSVSLAPDSNLNSATRDRSIEIFGLPFELDQNARARGGVSASLQTQISRSLPILGRLRLAGGGAASSTVTPSRDLDDTWLQARLGPELRFENEGRLSVQWVETSRWLGGGIYETTRGVRSEVSFGQGPLIRWDMSLRADDAESKVNPNRSGQVVIADIGRTRYLNSSKLWRFGATYATRDALSKVEAFNAVTINAGLLRPALFQTSLYLETYLSQRDFDAASFAFGKRRQDLEGGISARLTRRGLMWRGWSPYISATLSSARSTLVTGKFDRQRVEFGFTQTY